MNTKEHPQNDTYEMGKTLGGIDAVKSVSYEYPGFWEIETAFGTFSLGDVDGFFSWHTSDTDTDTHNLAGESNQYTIKGVAGDFAIWLEDTFEREILANAINARFDCGAFVQNTGGGCMAVEIPTNNPEISFILHGVEAGLEIWDYQINEALVQIDLTLFPREEQTAKKLTPHYLELIAEMMQSYPHLFTAVKK